MLGLLFTGLVIWRAYFSAYFGITGHSLGDVAARAGRVSC
jgi:cytochrome b subunit of formate dehydrogenase